MARQKSALPVIPDGKARRQWPVWFWRSREILQTSCYGFTVANGDIFGNGIERIPVIWFLKTVIMYKVCETGVPSDSQRP